MNDKINELLERVEAFKPKAAAEIEDFRIRMLGKKGELTALMEEFKSVAPELKREFGQKLNNLKNRTQERINALRKLKVCPFAQPYRDFDNNIEPTKEQKRLARWCNHKAIFKSVEFKNYKL